jgi:hypothetical protein
MMRTLADLDGAFALLEQVADRHRTEADPSAPGGHRGEVHELIRPIHRQHGGRSRLFTSVAVAAVAATVAIGVVVATSRTGDSPSTGTGRPDVTPASAPRSYPFTVDPALGLSVVAIRARAENTEVVLVDRASQVWVDTYPADPARQPVAGLQPVEINGHNGYYSDGAQDPFLGAPSAAPPTAPGADPSRSATPTPPLTRFARTIVWEYTADRWAQVSFQGSTPTKGQLERVARAVRFDGTHPMRSAARISNPPAGLTLVALDITYHEPGDEAPFDAAGADWYTLAQYASDAGDDEVTVEATSSDIMSRPGGESLRVNGRPASWHPSAKGLDGEVDVDAGGGRYFDVRGNGYSKDRLLAIAATVTVTDHPDDPSQWFVAGAALP